MGTRMLWLAVALTSSATVAFDLYEEDRAAANPIRKVVFMLQQMIKNVEAEGEKDKELHEKFMCYCRTNGNTLLESIAGSTAKIPEVESSLQEATSTKEQLIADIKKAGDDRAAAEQDMATAAGIRAKEAAAFRSEKAQLDENIAALSKAITAIDKGMSGGFLQTKPAKVLLHLLQTTDRIPEYSREELLSFLTATHAVDYSPRSGEISGILRDIKDDMEKSLFEAMAAEESSLSDYNGLMSAKKKEVEALTRALEEKQGRAGQLAVEIVTMKNDLSDTEAALLEDKQFQADLAANCATKETEWDAISKTRAEELVALSETIKILNDDDALDLFKKTLPSASASFVQVLRKAAIARSRVYQVLKNVKDRSPQERETLDFIMLALRGSKFGFEKVIRMIDTMVKELKQEQIDDDNKKEYCGHKLDTTDDAKKKLEQDLSDSETEIADIESDLANLVAEIKSLNRGIQDLDQSVAAATEQRKKEHASYLEIVSFNREATELLEFARGRLHKFYNSALQRPLESADRLSLISRRGNGAAPPPPPEAVGPYSKSKEGTNVISMIDSLIKDLAKEKVEAEAEERNAQAAFEGTMRDVAEKRAADSKNQAHKVSAKADLEGLLVDRKSARTSAVRELSATTEILGSLHAECDWMLKYFDVRKEARASEVEALGNAKAVLSGAQYSLSQMAGSRAKRINSGDDLAKDVQTHTRQPKKVETQHTRRLPRRTSRDASDMNQMHQP
eukprot:TRINITY_DN54929_c0_g1_i1.p1 TRINITY_DN54929_c0_g1~~TRINITY_DN54929_c0_g1_i1.p1  ORF type:complete len:736 (+),score=180.37 TRINITY_DN54929_c0_g1_i1:75-2282(+)